MDSNGIFTDEPISKTYPYEEIVPPAEDDSGHLSLSGKNAQLCLICFKFTITTYLI